MSLSKRTPDIKVNKPVKTHTFQRLEVSPSLQRLTILSVVSLIEIDTLGRIRVIHTSVVYQSQGRAASLAVLHMGTFRTGFVFLQLV